MLIRALKDMVYRNAFKRAGTVFEYDGDTVPWCAEAVAGEKPKSEPVPKPRNAGGKNKKD